MMDRMHETRERLRRPPCWGPNEQGAYMVDMEVEAYEADIDSLAAAADSDQERLVAAFLRLADELDKADPHVWTVLDGVTLGGAVRWELINLGLMPDPRITA